MSAISPFSMITTALKRRGPPVPSIRVPLISAIVGLDKAEISTPWNAKRKRRKNSTKDKNKNLLFITRV